MQVIVTEQAVQDGDKPIAWQLLHMKHIADAHPEAPPQAVLSDVQLVVLRAKLKQLQKRKTIPTTTAFEVLLAIAGLGGHLKRNGHPGWQTLTAGFDKLLQLVHRFHIANDLQKDL